MAALQVTPGAIAQQAVRNITTAQATAQIAPVDWENMPYTYKSGDFRLLAVPSLELDWNDNINISKTNTLQDFIVRPLMQLDATYPISQVNLLRVDIGLGYDEYLNHSAYSNWRVTSGSEVSFDTYIKDVLVNLHDRFYYFQDAGAQATLAGTGDYGSDDNVAGVTVTWNPGRLNISLGYDHENIIPSGTAIETGDSSSELVDSRVGWRFTDAATAGVEATYSSTSYDQAVLNNNSSYTIGAYGEWHPGSYFTVIPRAGYSIFQFQQTSQTGENFVATPAGQPIVAPTGVPIQTADFDAWYADLTLAHQITRFLTYSLSAGHEIQAGLQADAIADSYLRLSTKWEIITGLDLSGSFSYEHGQQGFGNITGNLTETFDWYTGGVTIYRKVTNRFSVGLNSRVTFRDSTVGSLGYTQSTVGLQMAYALE
jgi:hypothetical protein